MERTQRVEGAVFGREGALAAIATAVSGVSAARGLLLTGEPGIGKTTLWEAGVGAARARGCRVLVARPADIEARLALAGLGDLLSEVSDETLAELPDPQREALDAALLRSSPTEAPTERATALGVLGVLRELARSRPVVVAVDDLQWLDPESAAALAFAARRLADADVRLLLARRPGPAGTLERALERIGLARLPVEPLSLAALRRLLAERLDLALPRHLLRRVHAITLGNPLFALELGRLLREQGQLDARGEIPVPESIEELLGLRVESLAPAARTLLLALSLSGELEYEQLTEIVGTAAVDEALAAGLLVAGDGRVRPFHPLLAAAATRRARPTERRALHRTLAGIVTEPQLRARHLALATESADAALASKVAAASAEAALRGTLHDAIELAEHALRLTPNPDGARAQRVLALAELLVAVGEGHRVADLLGPALEWLSGPERVRAYLLLWHGSGVSSRSDIQRVLDQALAACHDDPVLGATVLGDIAKTTASLGVERIAEVERWALEALEMGGETAAAETALEGLAWARALRGLPIGDVLERFRAVADGQRSIDPQRIAGQRLVWRGELDEGRRLLTPLFERADERGDASFLLLRLHVCELELRAGRWDDAEALLDDWGESNDRLVWPMYERCRGLLAAGRGDVTAARAWARQALEAAEAKGVRWDLLEARRTLGLAALLADDPTTAAAAFREVWQHTESEGIDEPGVFPVAPDLVEALVELGERDEALEVAGRLRELSERQAHPWGRTSALRSEALIALGRPVHDDDAANGLRRAAAEYLAAGLPFDAARTLLILGRALRRHRKWRAARTSLDQASEAFECLGSAGWATAARSELERVGARRPRARGELTPAEARTAGLAAQGLSNKEIARSLHVSAHTVEAHLSKTYAKLGIRSRTQLASRLPKD